MKQILVRLEGDESDRAILEAGLTAARAFGARLDCLYVLPRASSMVLDATPVAALTAMFEGSISGLGGADRARAQRAHDTFQSICAREAVAVVDGPPAPRGVSAAWREIVGLEDLVADAALSDLVVENGVWNFPDTASDYLARLLIESGCPVLLPHLAPSPSEFETVAVAWDNTLQAARALSAATPFLVRAKQIIVLHASEDGEEDAGLGRVVDYLGWRGLKARYQAVTLSGRPAAPAIAGAAAQSDVRLLVAGGYGRSHLEESVFGGFTQDMLNERRFSLFLVH